MSQPPYPTAPGASSPYPSQPAGYGTTTAYPQAGYPPSTQQGYPPAGSAPYPGGAPQQGYPPASAAPPPAPYPPQQGVPSYQQPVGAPAGAAGGLPPPPAGYVDQPTFKGETSADVVKDDPKLKEPQPTAPPIENMDHISGYDGVTFGGGGFAPPPSYDDAMRHPPPDSRPQVTNLPVINEDQAREALLQYVAQNCCYGSGAAKNMTFRDLKSSSAFHYTLETFAESRSTAWAYEPFKGQAVDGPNMGPAPLPWDIPVNPGDKFMKKIIKLEVPHTASVKPCHTCAGVGRTRCYRCHGRGQVICSSCSGRGRVHDFHHDHNHHHHGDHHHHHHHHHGPDHKPCTWCHGTGRRRCYTCHGHGQVNCKTCDARGQLKCFIQLTVNWNNHFEDHIVERTALPSELIRDVQGQLAFEEEHPRVWPINHFPDQQINSASNSLVQKHNTAFPTERILKQRHRVRIVPVTEAVYEYKGKTDSYFVFGFENKIYAPKYPETCCCGCTVL